MDTDIMCLRRQYIMYRNIVNIGCLIRELKIAKPCHYKQRVSESIHLQGVS